MGRLSDFSLVTQVAVFQNKRAFDQLVREHQSSVRRFFLNQTLGDEPLSDDLAQDTFLKAYTNIGKFRATASFRTWLTRIAYNVWYDYCRSHRLRQQTDLTDTAAATQADAANGALRQDIYHALSLLKADERSCITLQLIDGYSTEEIARLTGMPQGTVKSHLKRGKDKLTTFLKQNGYDR